MVQLYVDLDIKMSFDKIVFNCLFAFRHGYDLWNEYQSWNMILLKPSFLRSGFFSISTIRTTYSKRRKEDLFYSFGLTKVLFAWILQSEKYPSCRCCHHNCSFQGIWTENPNVTEWFPYHGQLLFYATHYPSWLCQSTRFFAFQIFSAHVISWREKMTIWFSQSS